MIMLKIYWKIKEKIKFNFIEVLRKTKVYSIYKKRIPLFESVSLKYLYM